MTRPPRPARGPFYGSEPLKPRLRSPAVLALALAGSVAASLGCTKLPDVPNVPPQAAFIFTPVSPVVAGFTNVTFNASGSRDDDGRVASYVWDFGDGTGQVTSGEPVAHHVFQAAGCPTSIYVVLLTVVDDAGDRGSASQSITVSCPLLLRSSLRWASP